MIVENEDKVREAADIWRRSPGYGPEQWEVAVKTLARHGLWSKAQVRAITGAPVRIVARFMTKSDHTGGRLNPATLELVLEEFTQAGRNPNLTAAILSNGTSAGMLGRLLGESPVKVQRRAMGAVA